MGFFLALLELGCFGNLDQFTEGIVCRAESRDRGPEAAGPPCPAAPGNYQDTVHVCMLSREHAAWSTHPSPSRLPLVCAEGGLCPCKRIRAGGGGDAPGAQRHPGRGRDRGVFAARCVFLFALEG